MNKIQIISDQNNKSLTIKKVLIKKIISNNFFKKNLTIVIGGDGVMLKTLKKNRNVKRECYGINYGKFGFLMNKFYQKNIIKNLVNEKKIYISRLEMMDKNKKKKRKK